jgi:hypothetical protein
MVTKKNISILLLWQLNISSKIGIPDEPGLRSTAWKVLLGYLPPDKRMWESVLKDQRLTYYVRKDAFHIL